MITYHQAQLLRLLSLFVVFGVLTPALCWFVVSGFAPAKRFAKRELLATRRVKRQIS